MSDFSIKIRKYPILAKRFLIMILVLSFVLWVYLIINPLSELV
jgi:branched-chain amino acid transport system substrate-binding protein